MGLFDRDTETYVSSVVYNLAGDINDRPQVMRTAIAAAVLEGNRSISEAISSSFLTGMGVKLRGFANWADYSGYNDAIGLVSAQIVTGHSIDQGVIATEVPATVGYTVSVRKASIDQGDYTFWADQYVCDNFPSLLATNYRADIDEITNVITITFEDTSTATFVATDFDAFSRYLYVSYVESSGIVEDAVVTGSTVTLGPSDSFPGTTGWVVTSNVTTTVPVTLDTDTTIDITYSDATPPSSSSSTSSTSSSYDDVNAAYKKTIRLADVPGVDAIQSERQFMYHDTVHSIVPVTTVTVTTETISGGVIKTTTTTVVTDTIVATRTHRTDTQHIQFGNWSPAKIYIYKEFSGNAILDAMFNAPEEQGKFFPFVPFRVNNNNLTEGSELYAVSKKAFRKATGTRYEDVLKGINENPSIGDIDYTYAVFGTPLNTKDNSCRKYIYEFFKALNDDPTRTGEAEYQAFITEWQAADASWDAWEAWRASSTPDPEDEPERLPYPALPQNSLTISSSKYGINFWFKLSWAYTLEEVGYGLLKEGAKAGEFWFTKETAGAFQERVWTEDTFGGFGSILSNGPNTDIIHLNWQETDTVWRRIQVCGFVHHNYVYAGKAVVITAFEALNDDEESGCIIPLQEGVYKQIGLKHGTQMATGCCMLVFNCYQQVKEKWYQTGWFKLILIVAIVVLTIVFPPAGGLAGALGFTGVTAVLINIAVAYLVTGGLTKLAVDKWGEEKGAIIGAVLSVITLQVASSMITGPSLSASFGSLLSAPNLLMLTNSVGNAYANYMKAGAQQDMNEAANLQKQYEDQLKSIQEKMEKEFGQNGLLDPSLVADILLSPHETPASFLQRTLMVGSDIADLSIDMLRNFANITLSTDLQNI